MWRSSIHLGAVLTVVVALVVVTLSGQVADATLVVAVFAASSVLGWANVHRFRPAFSRRR